MSFTAKVNLTHTPGGQFSFDMDDDFQFPLVSEGITMLPLPSKPLVTENQFWTTWKQSLSTRAMKTATDAVAEAILKQHGVKP